jgi:urease accessory protein
MSANKVTRIIPRKSSVSRPVLTSLLLVVLCPLRAEAHLNSTGMGPVYDGMAHFLLSPEDLVPVLALALLAGQRGAGHGRRTLFVLPVAWLLGGFIGLAVASERGAGLTALSFLLFGGLVAADARVSLPVLTLLAVLLGLFHGYLNGAAMQQVGFGTETLVVALVGLVLAVSVLVTLAAAFVVRLQRPWARIAIRVMGSWIVASGVLMVGWAVRKG